MLATITTTHITSLTVVGIATIVGYYAGHCARLIKLPSIIGYMIVGVILGPSIFGLFRAASMEDMSFITEIALGFVAFSIGSELSISSLRKLGPGIISIIFSESFTAFFLVTGAVYIYTGFTASGFDLPLALIFGAMAPAGTVAVIHECKSKGNLTKALYAVVGFDDGLAIIIFGFAAAIAKVLLVAESTGETISILPSLVAPCKEIALSMIVGTVIGFVFCQMVRFLDNSRDILIIVFGAVLLATGLSTMLHLSLILTNMVIGFVLVNTRREALVHRVTSPLLEVMPLLFVLFFCLAGAHLDLKAIPALGILGGVYILARSAGLIGGAWIGGMIAKVDENVKKYIGMGILSQAGVAIGLALIAKHELSTVSAHGIAVGTTVLTSVTATCIFFEVIGPILTKVALKKAGEIPTQK